MDDLSGTSSTLGSLTDHQVRSIAQQIDATGIFCMKSFLSELGLAKARQFVNAKLDQREHKTVSLARDEMSGSGLDELAHSEQFKNFCARLYSIGFHHSAPEVEFYQILRCLTGRSAMEHSLMFHYDSYLITFLIPIEIPTEGPRGDFLIIPNTRGVRSTYAMNLVDKALVDNKLTQWLLRTLRLRDPKWMRRVHLSPGNLYIFWGYCSIHTNEPVDEHAVRATALFHYVDPHAESRLKRSLRGGGNH
ncbi:hypothetical protein ASE04_19165 [Rhizobium sp. Root708]|nr:hypothetical protein ASE04_19165 [Rhizobium sp. Root708]